MKSSTERKLYMWIILAAFFYIICIFIGMALYAGGSQIDPTVGGYSISGNTLSDIGRMVAINGEPNLPAAIFFFLGTGVYGLSLLLFVVLFQANFHLRGQGKITSQCGLVFGIVAALGTLVYTFAPTDTMELLHLIGVYFAYMGTFLFTFFYGIATLKNPDLQKVKVSVVVIMISFTFIYLGSLIVFTLDISIPISMYMQKLGRGLMLLVLISISAIIRHIKK
jgi:hypothetical protein